MKLYMIRHGETDWNKAGKLQGHSDTKLNEKGRTLAKVTGQALADIPFDLAISSPLQRALDTAGLVLNGKDIPVKTDDRIMEIGFGVYEGVCMHEKGAMDEKFQKFFTAPEEYAAPEGGESIEDVRKRTGDFLRELAETEAYQEKTILVATHGAAMKGLITNITGEPVSQYWRGGVHKNCAVSLAECKDGVYTLVFENRVYYTLDI